ncbi:MAG: four helix bundle protein [Verrucomicrobiaceae bacterium]
MRFDEEFRRRTKQFASRIVRLYSRLPRERREVEVLGHQLLRSGTSVAAHIREASRARSDSEFCSKCDVALQEADESQLWMELLDEDCRVGDSDLKPLHQESDELIAILVTIVSKTRTGRG